MLWAEHNYGYGCRCVPGPEHIKCTSLAKNCNTINSTLGGFVLRLYYMPFLLAVAGCLQKVRKRNMSWFWLNHIGSNPKFCCKFWDCCCRIYPLRPRMSAQYSTATNQSCNPTIWPRLPPLFKDKLPAQILTWLWLWNWDQKLKTRDEFMNYSRSRNNNMDPNMKSYQWQSNRLSSIKYYMCRCTFRDHIKHAGLYTMWVYLPHIQGTSEAADTLWHIQTKVVIFCQQFLRKHLLVMLIWIFTAPSVRPPDICKAHLH